MPLWRQYFGYDRIRAAWDRYGFTLEARGCSDGDRRVMGDVVWSFSTRALVSCSSGFTAYVTTS